VVTAMAYPSYDRITLFFIVISLALFLAEMQTRRVATLRWVCLALVWIIAVAMLIFVYSGA